MNTQLEWINGWFNLWREDVERAKSLISTDKYLLEGILVLLCYIGALARIRYILEKRGFEKQAAGIDIAALERRSRKEKWKKQKQEKQEALEQIIVIAAEETYSSEDIPLSEDC